MIPSQKEVTQHVNATIAVLKEFAKTEFDVNVDELKPVIGFRDCNRTGRAGMKDGKPFMKLNLGEWVTYETVGCIEYRALARYPAIGGFYTTDWKLSLEALIYHEFAHNVQFMLKYSKSRLREANNYFKGIGYFEANHGPFFQRIYAIIRNKFLNHRIQPCYANPPRAFDKPDASPVARNGNVIKEFAHKGTRVKCRGKIYTVCEYKVSNRKYPYIGVSDCGQYLKMPLDYLLNNAVNY